MPGLIGESAHFAETLPVVWLWRYPCSVSTVQLGPRARSAPRGSSGYSRHLVAASCWTLSCSWLCAPATSGAWPVRPVSASGPIDLSSKSIPQCRLISDSILGAILVSRHPLCWRTLNDFMSSLSQKLSQMILQSLNSYQVISLSIMVSDLASGALRLLLLLPVGSPPLTAGVAPVVLLLLGCWGGVGGCWPHILAIICCIICSILSNWAPWHVERLLLLVQLGRLLVVPQHQPIQLLVLLGIGLVKLLLLRNHCLKLCLTCCLFILILLGSGPRHDVSNQRSQSTIKKAKCRNPEIGFPLIRDQQLSAPTRKQRVVETDDYLPVCSSGCTLVGYSSGSSRNSWQRSPRWSSPSTSNVLNLYSPGLGSVRCAGLVLASGDLLTSVLSGLLLASTSRSSDNLSWDNSSFWPPNSLELYVQPLEQSQYLHVSLNAGRGLSSWPHALSSRRTSWFLDLATLLGRALVRVMTSFYS